VQFQGGGTLNLQGANATVSGGVTTIHNLNQVAAHSGHAVVGVFAGANSGVNLAQVEGHFGNAAVQAGIDRFIRNVAGTVVGFGNATVEFSVSGTDTIPGFAGSRTRVFLAPGASGIATQNGVITEGTSANTNAPYVILTGSISGVTGTAGRFATIN